MSKIVDLTGLSRFWSNVDKKKASIDGTYPLLVSGDLAGRGESVPASFGFRASGGKSIKDGRAYIKRIKGNSVVWNQKLGDASWSIQFNNSEIAKSKEGATYIISYNDFEPTEGDKGSHGFILLNRISFHAHKYLFIADAQGQYIEAVKCGIYDGSQYLFLGQGAVNNNRCVYFHTFSSAFISNIVRFDVNVNSSNYAKANTIRLTPRIYDLTQMFGAGNEPSTIEEFNARVATLGIEDMYAYNEGQVIHCNTESIKSIGDNAWDEQWENGTFDITSGEAIDGSWVMGQIRSENPLSVLPNEEYYVSMGKGSMWVIFLDKEGNAIESPAHNGLTAGNAINVGNGRTFKTPTNAAFLKFYCTEDYGNTYNHDILISLYHSGWKAQKDDQYQPYWQDILPLPIILKYFPDGMKKAGTAHDEIRYNKASGKWEYSKGKIKSVDLGTLNWKNLNASNGMFWLSRQEVIDLNMATHDNENIPTNLISSLYASAPTYDIVNIDKVFRGPFTTKFSGYLTVKDKAYTDAASFKAAMSGVMLYYESNNWEWEELDAEDQNFRDYYNVADFGTEQSQSNVPSAAFSADIIYQFNAVDMIREHEAEINELQSVIATMQAQLASLINK